LIMRGQFTGKPNRRVRRVPPWAFCHVTGRTQVPTKIRRHHGFPTQI
jgi:hypothetical protein